MTNTILFNQWFASLPVLVVWTVGLILAVKRWREHPQIFMLVAIACGVALLTLIFMPVAMQVGYQIKFAFIPPLLSLVSACLGALSIGLLLKATFSIRDKSNLPAPEEPGRQSQTVAGGPMDTALKILAGIVRWTYRGCSLIPFLFIGVFLLAGGIPKTLMHPSEWELGDVIQVLLMLLYLAALGLAWRWELLGGTLACLVLGIPTLIEFFKDQRGEDELIGYVAWAFSLLILLSWSLNTLKDAHTKLRSRRIAMILAPLLVIAIGFCVYRLPGAKFNP